MKTEPSESITNYATRLRKAASKCNFTNWSAEKMIKSLIISNMHDVTLRLKFLQKDRTLDQILNIARKKEDAVARSKVMDGDSRPVVNKVADKRNYLSQRTGPPDQFNRTREALPRVGMPSCYQNLQLLRKERTLCQ